jgi:sulfite exporter TauE/SafE
MGNEASLVSAIFSDHAEHFAHLLPSSSGALIGALFLAGLVGGAVHCTGMCGPFVLAQTAGRLGAIPVERFGRLTRAGGALLLPYHFGRATTYAVLGTAGAMLAGGLSQLRLLAWLRPGLLLFAALLMLAAALAKTRFALSIPKLPVAGVLSRFAMPLLSNPNGFARGFALGIALGFLPCGFLYGALAAASASGNAAIGAAAMFAFAAGTAPSLFAVALIGEGAGRRWRSVVMRFAPAAFTLNAVVLAWTAWRVAI